MKKLIIAAALLFASVAHADQPLRFVPCGYQQITSLSSAVSLTIPSSCGGLPVAFAVLKAEAQALRYRDDGTAPTNSVGMPMAVADPAFTYTGTLSALQFIEQTSGGKLDVLYYR
jgi:hypothetical protein